MAADPRTVLEANREGAARLARRAGRERLSKILEKADRDLVRRLAEAVSSPGKGTYTHEQVRAALHQVRLVARQVAGGIGDVVEGEARPAAEIAAEGTLRYMSQAESFFRGISSQPLALDEAAVLDAAVSGANASVLRRLASSGEPVAGADDKPHPAKRGILDRYGIATVERFEGVLQNGILTKKSWAEVRADIVAESPFLQGAPAHWAERIVRNEFMSAYNRAGWEANREADEQLGDVVKILSATFDDRTASDSYAVHGQVRLPDEAFESWYGLYQHPPNRPNDREIVVPHRIAWPIPPYLRQREPGEVAARWALERRKGAVLTRPLMTTVELSRFGRG